MNTAQPRFLGKQTVRLWAVLLLLLALSSAWLSNSFRFGANCARVIGPASDAASPNNRAR